MVSISNEGEYILILVVKISKLLHWAGEKIINVDNVAVFFSIYCEVLTTLCFLYITYTFIARESAPKTESDLIFVF